MRFFLGRNIYFKLKHESVKNIKSKLKIRIIPKSDLTQFNPSTNYLLVWKQTKCENIFDIEFRLTRINQENKGLKATAAQVQFSKEKHCYYIADSCHQIKDLLTENVSFIWR